MSATASEAGAAPSPGGPVLYEVNTRVLLRALSDRLGRAATLDDIEDARLDGWAACGIAWIWLLGVWRTGEAGRAVSRADPEWRRGYLACLPDLEERDICGSCFAVTGYVVSEALGGEAALRRFRARLAARGCRLMLDFVPNHTAPDHPFVHDRPSLYVAGTEADLAAAPGNYARVATGEGMRILAHGRDPYFPGWPDTLQLDYGAAATQAAMRGELLAAASLCDGLRCDMAMLLLPEVFRRTWGIEAAPFWPEAIRAVRERAPGFLFLAEVYWDLEATLLAQGFDYAYDKRLYDRLAGGDAGGVRAHLGAGISHQRHLARFLENHDERRAAAVFGARQRPAAAVTLLAPGLALLHDGQFEGRRVHVPVHLCRAPEEPADEALASFYAALLAARRLVAEATGWRLLALSEAWAGNPSWQGFVAAAWCDAAAPLVLVVANYAPHRGQCYVALPFAGLAGRQWCLEDQLSPARYLREGDALGTQGLYLDMPEWGCHVFRLSVAAPGAQPP